MKAGVEDSETPEHSRRIWLPAKSPIRPSSWHGILIPANPHIHLCPVGAGEGTSLLCQQVESRPKVSERPQRLQSVAGERGCSRLWVGARGNPIIDELCVCSVEPIRANGHFLLFGHAVVALLAYSNPEHAVFGRTGDHAQ